MMTCLVANLSQERIVSIKPVFSSEIAQYISARRNVSTLSTGSSAAGKQSPDYSVHISTLGAQQLSQKTDQGDTPLEYYALPKWYADLFPIEVNPDIGIPVSEMYLKGAKFADGQYSQQLGEYDKLLQTYFQKACASEGIKTAQQYHDALNSDQQIYEKIHQNFMSDIFGDRRMQELMKLFEIT